MGNATFLGPVGSSGVELPFFLSVFLQASKALPMTTSKAESRLMSC